MEQRLETQKFCNVCYLFRNNFSKKGFDMNELKDQVKERLSVLSQKSNDYAHDQPWIVAILIALIAGLVGFLLGRGSRRN